MSWIPEPPVSLVVERRPADGFPEDRIARYRRRIRHGGDRIERGEQAAYLRVLPPAKVRDRFQQKLPQC